MQGTLLQKLLYKVDDIPFGYWFNEHLDGYKMCNEEICGKEGSDTAFFQSVAESMVNISTKWSAYSKQDSVLVSEDNDNNGNEGHAVMNTKNSTCIPAGLDSIMAKIGVRMRVCQVCSYEM
jgi:hypothetical protein